MSRHVKKTHSVYNICLGTIPVEFTMFPAKENGIIIYIYNSPFYIIFRF